MVFTPAKRRTQPKVASTAPEAKVSKAVKPGLKRVKVNRPSQ